MFLRDIYLRYPFLSNINIATSVQFTFSLSFNQTGATITLGYSSYLSSVLSSYSVRWTVILIDQQAVLYNNNFKIQLTTGHAYPSSSYAFSSSYNVSDPLTSVFAGITMFYYSNDNPNAFAFDVSFTTYAVPFSTQGGSTASYFDCWIAAYYACPHPLYISYPSNRTCEESCPHYQFLNQSSGNCTSCANFCYTCSNDSTTCLSCNPSDYRTLNNSHCAPMDSFYESNLTVAASCDTSCKTCSVTSINCTSCYLPTVLFNNQCLSCANKFPHCYSCT